MKLFDQFEITVPSCLLSAIINGDESGLEETDLEDLEGFRQWLDVVLDLHPHDSHVIDVGGRDEFGRSEVGECLRGDVTEVIVSLLRTERADEDFRLDLEQDWKDRHWADPSG